MEVDAFTPAWWCRSAHAQTVWASALRPMPQVFGVRRERWDTPDGDFLDVDHVPTEAGWPTLIILHGFESSSAAQASRGLLRAAARQGWRGLGINFRSCSGAINELRRSYHAGETSDLHWIIQRVVSERPHDPVCCVGSSLGANVLLKYLGEQADRAPAQLKAAVAISAPFDLAISARAFEQSVMNRVYMSRLIRSLKQKTLAKLRRYPDLVDRARLEAMRTIREFDDLVTAPVHGFVNAEDYWTASSCRQFLPSIRRPTLLISSVDDPIIPADVLPRQEVTRNRWLTGAFTEAGGHVGFISGPPWRPVAWAEQRAMVFFAQHLSQTPPHDARP